MADQAVLDRIDVLKAEMADISEQATLLRTRERNVNVELNALQQGIIGELAQDALGYTIGDVIEVTEVSTWRKASETKIYRMKITDMSNWFGTEWRIGGDNIKKDGTTGLRSLRITIGGKSSGYTTITVRKVKTK